MEMEVWRDEDMESFRSRFEIRHTAESILIYRER